MNTPRRRIAFYTLGCRVNQYESEQLAARFREDGFEIVDGTADAYIINTCTVTSLADRKSRQFVRRAQRANPDAVVAVIGCWPETAPEAAAQLEGIDILSGTEDKDAVVAKVEALLAEKAAARQAKKTAAPAESPVGPSEDLRAGAPEGLLPAGERCRAMIKIEDGCDRFCSYCVIPYARGRVRSRGEEEIVAEAKGLIVRGYKEIVLTGINTALYGTDRPQEGPGTGIERIVALLDALPGDFRIRLSSLEPTVVDADCVKRLLRYPKLCRHLHLSVQSGSDRILAAMDRRYTRTEYLEIVRILRDADPLFGITTDLIVGFPGETEEDFEESLDLVKQAGYLKVHAFAYSKRPFTKAAALPGQIAPQVKKERSRRLIDFADEVSLAFRKKMEGSAQRVLFEEPAEIAGHIYWKGHASNFCPVYLAKTDEEDYTDRFLDVIIKEPLADGVRGERKENAMSDCIFCKIANKEIPTDFVYEDERIACFRDLDPQAPVHVLIIPKKHLASLNEASGEDAALLSHMLLKAKEIAAQLGLENGYRLVINTGEDGGQSVKHLHMHLLGKRSMNWPPG